MHAIIFAVFHGPVILLLDIPTLIKRRWSRYIRGVSRDHLILMDPTYLKL